MRRNKIIASMLLPAVIGMMALPVPAFAMTQQQAQIQAIRERNIQMEMERQINNRYNAGLRAYASGNYTGCLQNLMNAAVKARFQDKKDYNIALGDSFFRIRDYRQAVLFLQRSYNMGGANIYLVNFDLGMSYYAMKDFQQATSYLQRIAMSSLVDGDTLWALASSYDNIGNTNGMLSTLETLIQRYPSYNKEMYISVGMAYLDKNNLSRALSVFQTGLQYFKNDGDLLYWAGHTCYVDGNLDGAIPYLEKSNQAIPNNIDTLYDLGSSYLAYERLDEAAACSDIMMKINKNNPKTQDLYKAVQQKIMQRQMEQQMQMDMINEQIQEAQNAASMAADPGIAMMSAGMM